MTTAYQIIVDAYRQSNLIALGVEPTQKQEDEALRYLNRIVASAFGNEVGDPLTGFPIGRNNIERPIGYPWWNTVPDNYWFVPKNTRCNLNIDQAGITLYLDPAPDDGTRFAVVDASENLATYPVTVKGNGFFIEGSEEIVLSTNGLESEWFFRADLGEWVKYSPLTLFDTFPFPVEFDDFFILNLAFRLNPAYQRELDPQSQYMLTRAKSQINARYSQTIPTRSELALIRPSKMAADRDQRGNSYWLYQPNAMFDKGWPW